jgi:hypothetical protein
MRNLILSAVGAAALAIASSASAAVVTVGATSGIDSTSTNNGATQSTVTWTTNTFPAGDFTGWIEFTNDTAGLYQVLVGTSTPLANITSISLDGTGGGAPHLGSIVGSAAALTLGPISPVDAGAYRVTFGGNTPTDGVVTGNLTFQLIPVPEPATWAMMLVGFAGIGMAMRRRARPVLAQLA